MHYTAVIGATLHDAKELGWKVDHPKHEWETMVECVNNYIRGLNWGYRGQLKEVGVKYFNNLASFAGPHTISYKNKDKEEKITGKNIIIAVGGRPWMPSIPGIEHAISSDDIFWQQKSPGKTLCVGASYISLETAGFLKEFGLDVSVMVRSILLRGFDRECAQNIGMYMHGLGIKFYNTCEPSKIEKLKTGKLKVTYIETRTDKDGKATKTTKTDEFDTVLFATGRSADTTGLGLDKAGVKTNKKGKFETKNEQTNVEHIYAIGDVCEGKQELTPVAIQAGTLLARRLVSGSKVQMDYENVSTTVFTPLEYGAIGLGEEDAKARYGEKDVEVYISKFTALEHAATHRVTHDGEAVENPHQAKLVCIKSQQERVVGFHYLGPNAGEVTQGFGLAMKLGATKADFDNVVGIHPTTAEQFTTLKVTKSSGEKADAGGC
eukprot:UN30171